MTVVIVMMIIKTVMRKLINMVKRLESWAEETPEAKSPTEQKIAQLPAEIQSIWDYVAAKENTQAAHLISVVGFEEWVEMPEIKRRVKELFGMEYKNDRSLYPYIKTLVDCGFFESTDIGGKRKWKKKALLLKLKGEKKTGKIAEKEAEASN